MKQNVEISRKHQLNEYSIRISSFLTVIICFIGIWFKIEWIFFFLTVDFTLRGFLKKPSPFSIFANLLVNLFIRKTKMVFSPPKRFAARIGAFFSLISGIFLSLNWLVFFYSIGMIFISCAILEAFANICVGCYIYDWIIAPFSNKRNLKN